MARPHPLGKYRWSCAVKGCKRRGQPVDMKRLTTQAQMRFAMRGEDGTILSAMDEGTIGLCSHHLPQFLVS